MAPSPKMRAWQRFKTHKRGFYSLIVFLIVFAVTLLAEFWCNDQPLLIKYQNQYYSPVFKTYHETIFGGDFETPTDYLDPYIKARLTKNGNWVLYPFNPYRHNTINDFVGKPNPAAPSIDNKLGTDDRGRDVLARLVYGFRISVLFALALTVVGTVLGVFLGAIQGYFGGKVDLVLQRLSEIWGGMPELYLLIILASFFNPSLSLLLVLLAIFSWMNLADYVRAEFLKNRQMDYIAAAKTLGLSHAQIMWRHVLPNSLTPVVAFLPFKLSGAILALTSLDFLGLGVPATVPSLGELLSQGKDNLDAWWIALPTFFVLTLLLLLLIFMGEGLRFALDNRGKS